MIRIERRLTDARWLLVAVPVGSLIGAVILSSVILVATGHDPLGTWQRLLDRGFLSEGAMSATLVQATPLLLTGLAAAAAFRMQTWNIGAEGQLYLGAVGASGAGIVLGSQPATVVIPAMVLAGLLTGAAWAAIPGALRAVFRTNEIITSLMLNYVAGLLITYLIFDSHSYWRELSTFTSRVFPQGKYLSAAAAWPSLQIAGIGIVVAALARLNPFAVILVALLLGGLSNGGFSLQGADFPAGLVGTLQGLILFCALAGELLVRYRIRVRRPRGSLVRPADAAVRPA